MRRVRQQRPSRAHDRDRRSSRSRPGSTNGPADRPCGRRSWSPPGRSPARCRPIRGRTRCRRGTAEDHVLPDGVGEVLGDLPPANRLAGSCPYSQVGRPGRRAAAGRRRRCVAAAGGYAARTASAAAVYGSWSRKSGAAASAVDRGAQLVGRAAAKYAPRFAASITPGPPPVTTSRPARPAARPGGGQPVRVRPPRHGVPAHHPDDAPRAVRPAQPRTASPSALSMPASCSRWASASRMSGRAAAVGAEVPVDDGVVHAGEAARRRTRRPAPRRCRGGRCVG